MMIYGLVATNSFMLFTFAIYIITQMYKIIGADNKMILDFDLIESENSCSQSLYCSIVNWYKLDYKILFLYTWSFWFNSENSDIPIGLRIGRKNDKMKDILNSFFSIQFQQIDTSQDFSNEIIEIIHNELLKNKPVIVGTNLYWCPWSKKYKKESRYPDKRIHPEDCDNIIIIGIDFDKKIVYCKEKNTDNKFVFATFNDIIYGCKKLNLLEKGDKSGPRNNFDWKKSIKRSLEYTNQNIFTENVFENMKELALHLKNVDLDLNSERNGLSDLYLADIPLLDRIMNIGRARKQFAKVLQYFVRNFDANQLSPFINDFYEIRNKWDNIKIIFLKGFKVNRLSRQTLDSIADEINNLSILEEKAFYDLRNIVK